MRSVEELVRELEAYFSGQLEASASGLSSAWQPIVVRAITGASNSVRDYEPRVNEGALVVHNRVQATLGRCVGRRTVAVLRARYTPATWARCPDIPRHFGDLAGLVAWLAYADRRLTEREIVRQLADSGVRGPGRTLKTELRAAAELELANALLDYRASTPRRRVA